MTQDQNGAGMTFFNGAGDLSVIYSPSFVTATVRSQKILGAEVRGRETRGGGVSPVLFVSAYLSVYLSIYQSFLTCFPSLFPHPTP